jgi:hypothetical protein
VSRTCPTITPKPTSRRVERIGDELDRLSDPARRHGDNAHFVVLGRDAAGVRKHEKPIVVQWCASVDGAFAVLPRWQRYGGEWTILPVEYTPAAHVGCSSSGPQ